MICGMGGVNPALLIFLESTGNRWWYTVGEQVKPRIFTQVFRRVADGR
jgi:hypothetical protein